MRLLSKLRLFAGLTAMTGVVVLSSPGVRIADAHSEHDSRDRTVEQRVELPVPAVRPVATPTQNRVDAGAPLEKTPYIRRFELTIPWDVEHERMECGLDTRTDCGSASAVLRVSDQTYVRALGGQPRDDATRLDGCLR